MPDVVIIESPNKRKKIMELMPGHPPVVATVGHFKDLPLKSMGVDPETMEPEFVYPLGKKKVADAIKSAAKGARVYIATDPDREGYAIGTHVFQVIQKGAVEIIRLEIREITPKGMAQALANAVPFEKTNLHLYDAFLGRRVGDRIVGYGLSPIASRELNGKFSVGRVQSPAVRLVVEREREIRAFVPEAYWVVHVVLEKGDVRFKAFHDCGNIKEEAVATEVVRKVVAATTAQTVQVEEKEARQAPRPPFTTADLQIAASSRLRFSPERTMALAQDLFEAALQTYHRTDSRRIADDFLQEIRVAVGGAYGSGYLPGEPRRYGSKGSQADAHEAIRPTHMHPLSECAAIVARYKLTAEHASLYELVCRRTMACQMSDAIFDTVTARFDVAGEVFKSRGKTMKFDGFLKVYAEESGEGAVDKEAAGAGEKAGGVAKAKVSDDEPPEQKLPLLVVDEVVPKVGEAVDRKETKPPRRYSEAGLVKALEKLRIGRPSTYASILKTIKGKKYVALEKGSLRPSPDGERIVDYLIERHGWAIDYEMTRQMEDQLDEIEEGRGDWKAFVRGLKDRIPGISFASREKKPGGKRAALGSSTARRTSSRTSSSRGASSRSDSSSPRVTSSPRPAPRRVLNSPGVLASTPSTTSEKPLSPKQMAVIDRYGTEEVKRKVGAGDVVAGRAFLDDHFKKLKGSWGGPRNT